MILIRADANEHIGTGHVMRCLSIARAFAERGKEVLFVTADHRGEDLIHAGGFPGICMNSPWQKMEQERICQIVAEQKPELVLVDSYSVTPGYLSGLSALTRTAYMDDLNACVWDVDFLINYNLFGPTIDYSGYNGSRTVLLLGPQYAPLRPEFCGIGPHPFKDVTDILVSAGGSDPERITERLMLSVCPFWRDVSFHFVVGALNPRLEEIKNLAGKSANIVLHINEKRMSLLMQYCDLAVSAAGSTMYELCACGTPTIAYILADNQTRLADGFSESGMMLSVGDCRHNDRFVSDVKAGLDRLIGSSTLRKELSEHMQQLIDGRGAERLVCALLSQQPKKTQTGG